jgi:hypothetical protein
MTGNTETLRTEAALCVWEEIAATPNGPWEAYREAHGTPALRHLVMALAPKLLAHWDALTEQEREEQIPYDWEYCARWPRLALDWDEHGAEVRPDALERIKAAPSRDAENDAAVRAARLLSRSALLEAADAGRGLEPDDA